MKSDVQKDVVELGEILERLEAAENSGDAEYVVRMMADDVVVMVPNEPVQEGKAACAGFVRGMLAFMLEQFDRRIAYVSAETRLIGDYAFDRGTFSFTVAPKAGGETTRAQGKYLWLLPSLLQEEEPEDGSPALGRSRAASRACAADPV
jgi:ketosteroid isomerase-like protein